MIHINPAWQNTCTYLFRQGDDFWLEIHTQLEDISFPHHFGFEALDTEDSSCYN